MDPDLRLSHRRVTVDVVGDLDEKPLAQSQSLMPSVKAAAALDRARTACPVIQKPG
jgi:hypothetical protein